MSPWQCHESLEVICKSITVVDLYLFSSDVGQSFSDAGELPQHDPLSLHPKLEGSSTVELYLHFPP